MADARLTQAPALSVEAGAADARATQAGVYAVDGGGAGSAWATHVAVYALTPAPAEEGRLSQALVLGVTADALAARLSQAPLLAVVDEVPCLTRWAQCWKITRRDGAVFGFTDHDRIIEFQGVEFKPCSSLSASALELAAMLGSVGNAELRGIIDHDSIAEADLFAGLFDGALVEVWMVPWQDEP